MPDRPLLSPPRSYLVVVAHPDDADFGVAGTAARLARDGNAVHYLVLTSGDAGTEDPDQTAEGLMRQREDEQDAAGRVLGLAGTHYPRFADGELEPNLALRKAIVRVMRRVKADVVLTLDPRMLVSDDSRYLNHPDHRAAGQAALDAAFPAAGNRGHFRDLLAEGLEPHKVKEVWLGFTDASRANHFMDITETLDLKIRALLEHKSQVGEWGASGALAREMTKWAEEAAERHHLPFRHAEGFQRVVLTSEADREEKPTEAEAVKQQAEPATV